MIVAWVLLVALPMKAERVTPETARKAAHTFLNSNGAKAAQLTDLTKAAGFNNLYVFGGTEGFVVMSADDCAQPILGYSLTGQFVAEGMPDHVREWLQGYSDEIQYAIESQAKPTAATRQQWADLTEGNAKAAKATAVVDALVQTRWDQDPIYNNLCPLYNNQRTVTGCVATAMAQIMRYWQHPTQGTGSHSYTWRNQTLSANFGNTIYDWANMPLMLNGGSSWAQITAVATLMYHCGVAVNMFYDIPANGGSGAYPGDIPSALYSYFGYKQCQYLEKSQYAESTWIAMLKAELDAHRPVQYNGRGTGGHAFVCDGYDNSNRFHFNWGWSGQNDGYYSLSSLTPGSGGSGGSNYVFTSAQSANFGIIPVGSASAPTNFSLQTQSRNVILTWTAASGAQSYDVYRNGALIGNTSATTYIDANLGQGTYSYYLTSIDANGYAGQSSSTQTANIGPIAANLSVTQQGNGATLTWTQPALTTAMLTYGSGSYGTNYGSGSSSNMNFYAGHRYPKSMLSANQKLTKVSFMPSAAGSYSLVVCTSAAGASAPETQVLHKQNINVTVGGNWFDINLSSSEQITVDTSKDLWVFLWCGTILYPFGADVQVSNSNGDYYLNHWNLWASTPSHVGEAVFLIRTYLQDPAFTYVLYDDNVTVASNISGSSYTLSNISQNTAHRYTLKTNFRGGLTDASNMAGLTVGTASLNSLSLNIGDKMTLAPNSSLTVNGTLSNANGAANLVIENGAQLINNTNGVKATVKSNITPYTEGQNDGWHLIASPVTEDIEPNVTNGLLANSYDLYRFDQNEHDEWRNHEAAAFDIEHKEGYLYANSGNPTLTFAGTLAGTTSATPLAYNGDVAMKGFNLIGNPYPCNAYVDGRSFYVLQDGENGSEFIVGDNPIPPCAAILVQAQGEGESVSFSKTPTRASGITIALTRACDRANVLVDRTRVSFNEGDRLSKYSLNHESSRLYIPQDGKDYAVAVIANDGEAIQQGEMPLSFKVKEDGTYALRFDLEGMDLEYLHLIDNMTGADVDLLSVGASTDSATYTFEAKTTDYASRFRLVFSEPTDGPSATDQPFAYYADGEIRIVADAFDASLQVIDMTGRIIVRTDVARSISTNGMTPGLYLLRVVNGDTVRTQKVIVE